MPSRVVGTWTTRTPRSHVAATNPARSVTAPPPRPIDEIVAGETDLAEHRPGVGRDRQDPWRPRRRAPRAGAPRDHRQPTDSSSRTRLSGGAQRAWMQQRRRGVRCRPTASTSSPSSPKPICTVYGASPAGRTSIRVTNCSGLQPCQHLLAQPRPGCAATCRRSGRPPRRTAARARVKVVTSGRAAPRPAAAGRGRGPPA